ncbi:rrp15p domain-containing protein [Ditylenchus destructor]|nr:rrp15p domain-containing protein [Ditylenchus destructor]
MQEDEKPVTAYDEDEIEMKTVEFRKEPKFKKPHETKTELTEKHKNKLHAEKLGYTKPNYGIDREKERKLLHLGTKGVVQLFNAVRDRQSFLDKKLIEMDKGSKTERRQTMEEIKSYDFQISSGEYSDDDEVKEEIDSSEDSD